MKYEKAKREGVAYGGGGRGRFVRRPSYFS
jgi:hypothetical protein